MATPRTRRCASKTTTKQARAKLDAKGMSQGWPDRVFRMLMRLLPAEFRSDFEREDSVGVSALIEVGNNGRVGE